MKTGTLRARFAVLPLALAAAFPGASFAQASENAEIQEVVVTATRIDQKLSDVIPSATVIARADIERSQAVTLVDLIQGQPGIEIGRNGGPGSLASIFMRGQNSNSVAVFVDGVRVQTDAIGSLKLVDIPPNQIEKVEILRGNMGAVYGEAATGGVIHIFTRSGAALSGPTALVSYGSRNTSDVALGYNVKGDDFRIGVTVQRLDTEGYSTMNANQISKANPDKDGFKRESVFLNAEKSLTNDISIGLQANNIDGNVAYDNGWDTPSDTHHSQQQSSDYTIYSKFKLSPTWTSRLGLTESNYKNRELKNNAANGQFDGNQRSIQWTNAYRIGLGNVTFGADAAQANFKTPTEYNRDTLGYYLGYSGLYQQWDFQANVRHDQVQSRSTDTTTDKTASTWLLGLGYLVTDDLKLTGLASTSFRAPSASELFGVAYPSGNLNLQPEQHKGYELGLSYKLKVGSLRLVRFISETQNAIDYDDNLDTNFNIGKVENQGYELSFDGSSNGWYYKFSAVNQNPINATAQTRLARRARDYASIDFGKSALGIDWGMQAIISSSRLDSKYTTSENSSYTLVHLTAAKKLTPEWTGRVKVENAFDQKYQLAYGYDAVPRGLFFTLQYQPR